LRGAFTVKASTQSLVETSKANSLAIFLISLLTLLAAAGVMFLLVRKLVVKPLSAAVQLATGIAGKSIHVAAASEELSSTSQQITANSEETSAQANVVSTSAQQVSQNLQTVATGAEEMGASIKEIAKNATE